jgi:predicted nucleotidyltransferase
MNTSNHSTRQKVADHHAALSAKYGSRNVFATMLYGSQNYHLSTPASDVDTKAMVTPSFGDFALKQKWLSTEETLPHGLSTVKDVRGMCENFLKSNVNFLECLFTDYVVVNPYYVEHWVYLKNHRDMVANADPSRLVHAAAGMAAQKFHALEKPFESKTEVLAKYGYDPKQLHHLCRLLVFLKEFHKTHYFAACLVPYSDLDWLLRLKTHPLPLQNARTLAEKTMVAVNEFLSYKYPPVNPQAKEFLNTFCLRLLREHLVHELQSGAELPEVNK